MGLGKGSNVHDWKGWEKEMGCGAFAFGIEKLRNELALLVGCVVYLLASVYTAQDSLRRGLNNNNQHRCFGIRNLQHPSQSFNFKTCRENATIKELQ